MVIPRSFFAAVIAAPLVSAIIPTHVNLAPRQQETSAQPTPTPTAKIDLEAIKSCTRDLEDIYSEFASVVTPPPAIETWFVENKEIKSILMDAFKKGDGEMDASLGCSVQFKASSILPNEKDDGKSFVAEFNSYTSHLHELQSSWASTASEVATRCAHWGGEEGDFDLRAGAGMLLSMVATNVEECTKAQNVIVGKETLEPTAAAATTPTAGAGESKDGDAAATSTSTAGAWRGRETGAAVAVVAGIVGAVVGF